jgi:hypothetical protein
VRAGEVARDEGGGPKVCHEPLIAADLFWWCYDRITPERPSWAEGWAPPRAGTTTSYRPRSVRTRARPGEVRFLVAGRVRCAVHGKVLVPATDSRGRVELHCGQEWHVGFVPCAHISARPVEQELCQAFLDELTLDERDVATLAQLAQQRQARQSGGALEDVRRRLDEERGRYERAKRLALEAPDLAADVLEDMRRAKLAVQDLERRLDELRAAGAPAAQAWQAAERAAGLAERIRATFLDWPREAQARVLALALDDAVLGWVSRYVLGVWMRWQGGDESRREVVSRAGKKVWWTAEEVEALRRYFGELTWDALLRMFPGRSVTAITLHANRLGLSRPKDGGRPSVPPVIFPEPQVANTMAGYGFGAVTASSLSSPLERPGA